MYKSLQGLDSEKKNLFLRKIYILIIFLTKKCRENNPGANVVEKDIGEKINILKISRNCRCEISSGAEPPKPMVPILDGNSEHVAHA